MGDGAPTWPDGTVRLPDAIERWLDGHFAGEKDDDADELDAARNATAVALWSLLYRQGDAADDQAALDVLSMAVHRPSPIGAWCVFGWDMNAYPISLWPDELSARRDADARGYGEVIYWPWGDFNAAVAANKNGDASAQNLAHNANAPGFRS